MSDQIQKRQGSDMVTLLERMRPEIEKALPSHISGDRMTRIALTALRSTPKLMACTPASFLGCVMSAAQLGLEPNTPLGQCYLIPRKNECTLLLGYQGMIDLTRRSGQVGLIHAHTVHEGDEFEWTLGLNPDIKHKPGRDTHKNPITHVYAAVKLLSGGDAFTVLTKSEVDARKARGAGGTAWSSDYAAMAKKTAFRALWTWIPKSAEMAMAAALDDAASGDAPLRFDPSVDARLMSAGVPNATPSVGLLAELNAEEASESGCGADEGAA